MDTTNIRTAGTVVNADGVVGRIAPGPVAAPALWVMAFAIGVRHRFGDISPGCGSGVIAPAFRGRIHVDAQFGGTSASAVAVARREVGDVIGWTLVSGGCVGQYIQPVTVMCLRNVEPGAVVAVAIDNPSAARPGHIPSNFMMTTCISGGWRSVIHPCAARSASIAPTRSSPGPIPAAFFALVRWIAAHHVQTRQVGVGGLELLDLRG